MPEAKHTPGPWTCDANTGEHDQHAINADASGGGPWRAVATVHVGRLGGGSRAVQADEAAANARLIADAPRLLHWIEKLEEAIGRDADANCNPATSAVLLELFASAKHARGEG